ncbi:C-terminal domain of homeodomain 1-domain-containing protein [Mycena haematopus]|nr:C-terminal domain of homeodomain 1-domain-containing protein [Mycena haematopus]
MSCPLDNADFEVALLLDIEKDLFGFISGETLAEGSAFVHKWAQLRADIESATEAGTLDADTAVLTYHVASKVSVSVNHLQGALHGLNLDEPAIEPSASSESETDSTPIPDSPSIRSDPSLPPYIEPAYKWLRKHLHNPYPKKVIKEKIADETGSSLERISDWFVKVRRRMGWTTLLGEDFGHKRVDLVAAAERHFLGTNPKYPLPVDIQGKFVQMEAFAHDMYAAKFVPSALSNKLMAAVKDLTPELQQKARLERLQKLQAQREAAKRAAYPSPAPSGASSPTSDAGRKRTYSEASDEDNTSTNKRSRTDNDAFALPSPPYSSHSSPNTRKRRLSDAGAPTSKRPRTNNRIASDPIVVTLSGTPDILADWFSSDAPGDTNLFEPGQLLDIKFFDPAELDLTVEEEQAPAPVQPIVQTTTLSTSDSLTFDIPAELAQLINLDNFPEGFIQQEPVPLDQSSSSFPLDLYLNPGVWQPELQPLVDPFAGNYDSGFITQGYTEPFGFETYDPQPLGYSAFPDGKASGHLIAGLLEQQTAQQYKNQNDYPLYQLTSSY